MTKKRYETEWNDCFRDEFEEWFFHEQGYNPFISQDDFRQYPDFKRPPEPPRIEFEFYTPNGEEHRVTFLHREHVTLWLVHLKYKPFYLWISWITL